MFNRRSTVAGSNPQSYRGSKGSGRFTFGSSHRLWSSAHCNAVG